jgi:hypothetical protein
MKKPFLFSLILIVGLFLYPGLRNLNAQLDDLGLIFAAGLEDAGKLSAAYIAPFANGFGATMNSGWYNTAKPHKLGGFDLTLTVSMAFVPSSAKSFDVGALGLSGDIINGVTSSPTAAGKKDADVSRLRYAEGPVTIAEFDLPSGTGLGFVPAPMLSLGIGLIKDTDIKIRFVPKINISDAGELGLWGIGLKHSLKQWIPGIAHLPVFNLSLQGGYTKFNLGAGLSFSPEDIGALDQTSALINFDNQKFDLSVSSFTANALVSADLPVITFYGGLGISSTTTNLKFLGYYPIPELDGATAVVTDSSVGEKDPIDIEIKHKSGNSLQPRINAGFKLKMAVVTLHADYTYTDYSVVTAGLGISFR